MKCGALVAPAISDETDAEEAEDHHGPSSVHSTPPTNTSANNPDVRSWRGFLALAASVAAGSPVLIGAATIAAPAIANPGVLRAKAIDVKGARLELLDAIWALEEAHDALKDAAAEFKAVWDLWGQWEKKNPRPGSPRAYRKWERRQDRYQEDLDELALKSAASLAFEWGGGDHPHLRGNQRMVAFSGAWDAVMLLVPPPA